MLESVHNFEPKLKIQFVLDNQESNQASTDTLALTQMLHLSNWFAVFLEASVSLVTTRLSLMRTSAQGGFRKTWGSGKLLPHSLMLLSSDETTLCTDLYNDSFLAPNIYNLFVTAKLYSNMAQRAAQIAGHLNYPNGLLAGQVAIITGSGQGIGAEAARLFANEGAKVVVSDIDAGTASHRQYQIES